MCKHQCRHSVAQNLLVDCCCLHRHNKTVTVPATSPTSCHSSDFNLTHMSFKCYFCPLLPKIPIKVTEVPKEKNQHTISESVVWAW